MFVTGFVIMILLLLSAAFTVAECVPWVIAVAESLLMQIFVTDPLITIGLVCLKLAGSFILLQADKKRNRKLLDQEIEHWVSIEVLQCLFYYFQTEYTLIRKPWHDCLSQSHDQRG